MALADCERSGAAFVAGKLDRLSHDVRIFLEVLDDAGVDIRLAEFSDVNAKTDEGRSRNFLRLAALASVLFLQSERIPNSLCACYHIERDDFWEDEKQFLQVTA